MTNPNPKYNMYGVRVNNEISDNVPAKCSICSRPFKNRKDWNKHCMPDDCLTHSLGYIQSLQKKIQRLEEQRDQYRQERDGAMREWCVAMSEIRLSNPNDRRSISRFDIAKERGWDYLFESEK